MRKRRKQKNGKKKYYSSLHNLPVNFIISVSLAAEPGLNFFNLHEMGERNAFTTQKQKNNNEEKNNDNEKQNRVENLFPYHANGAWANLREGHQFINSFCGCQFTVNNPCNCSQNWHFNLIFLGQPNNGSSC